MKLIRFRTCKNSLEALKTFGIDASPYGQFGPDEPLDIHFTNPLEGLSEEQLSILICKMRNHIQDTYRLSSFMIYEEGDELNERMWSKYADNGNGFALLYELKDIQDAVREAVKTEPIFALKPITYGKTIGCDSFLSKLLDLVEESRGDEIGFYRKLQDGKWITDTIREEIISVLTSKKDNTNYTQDKEYRLIDMRVEKDLPHRARIHVKPTRIYAKKTCPELVVISTICAQNGIPLTVLNDA